MDRHSLILRMFLLPQKIYVGTYMKTILAVAIAVILFSGTLAPAFGSVSDGKPWTFELRQAATSEQHKSIVATARAGQDTQVVRGDQVVAKWVSVRQGRENSFLEIPSLITRKDTKGELELLVLISQNDITQEDVAKVYSGQDMDDNVSLRIDLSTEGASRLTRTTRELSNLANNLGTKCYLAAILDGHANSAPAVGSTVYFGRIHITGDFTEADISDIVSRHVAKVLAHKLPLENDQIFKSILSIVATALIIAVIILGLFPAANIARLRPRMAYYVAALLMGGIFGGYWFGVTKSYGSGGGVMIVRYWVSILWVLVGAVVGAAIAFLIVRLMSFLLPRAYHNLRRICGLAKLG